MSQEPVILIAGASGYVGQALIPKLLEYYPNAKIIALSRSQREPQDPRVEWKACDLFSVKSLVEVLPESIDVGIYLVHSMGPTAQLDQGSFSDYDLILSDNFARATKNKGLKQIIYLGGLTPPDVELSLHLQSRLEVEEVFQSYPTPTTLFRAGLIIGDSGSSFQILLKLIYRLPLMVCPKWTQTLTSPVDLQTVVTALAESTLRPEHFHKTYDLTGCRPLTYLEMMQATADKLGRKRFFIRVPFFSPQLSRLWVKLVTNTPQSLIYPLIESLEHPMVARPKHYFPGLSPHRSYSELLSGLTLRVKASKGLFTFRAQRKTVRSVQRLPMPLDKDARWLSDYYFRWLQRFLLGLVFSRITEEHINMRLRGLSVGLISFKRVPRASEKSREVLHIQKGLLVSKANRGRMEFRVVLNGRFAIIALHDFRPSIPWYIYKYTQAIVHLLVMKSFSFKLRRRAKLNPHWNESEL